MVSLNKMSLALGATLAAVTPQLANAQDVYAECTCRTAEGPYTQGVGSVVFANGGVLVDNASASPGNAINVGSLIEVGSAGSAEILVGATCSTTVPANSLVSITQPGGPGTDLCVKVSNNAGFAQTAPAPAPTPAAGSPGVVALGVVGGGALLAIGLSGGGDGDKKKKRKKVSP